MSALRLGVSGLLVPVGVALLGAAFGSLSGRPGPASTSPAGPEKDSGCYAFSAPRWPAAGAPAALPGRLRLTADPLPDDDAPGTWRAEPLAAGDSRVAWWTRDDGRFEVTVTDGHSGISIACMEGPSPATCDATALSDTAPAMEGTAVATRVPCDAPAAR